MTRALARAGYPSVIARSSAEVDLRDQAAVRRFFETERPDAVFLAAARVGGIHANDRDRWDFLADNLSIEVNVLTSALECGCERLVFFGSSCVYPKLAPQPIREEYLLTGPLEPTNEPYAIAKIAGLKMVEAAQAQHEKDWVSLMPTNLYGPNDNFDLQDSHVLPALIRRFTEAKDAAARGEDPGIVLWGSGRVLREFLHVDDLADAAVMLMERGTTGLFNVGYGSDLSIRDLADLVRGVVGYTGAIQWDVARADGTPRKLLDSSRLRALGWKPKITLEDGVRSTAEWFLNNRHAATLS